MDMDDVIVDIPIPDFLNESSEDIHKRMIENASSDVNTIEGDFFWDSTRPTAEEHAYMTQIKLQNLLRIFFLQTTYGPYLDAKADDSGIQRKSATKAYGYITITGEPGTVIPLGTIVSTISTETKEGIEFETTNEAVINDSGVCNIDIESIVSGSNSKVLKDTITVLVTPLNGIKSITNESDLKGGTDQEDDNSLRERIFERKRNPGTSGNEAHYKIWAKNVPGVGDAKPFPLWDKSNGMNGNGTIKVVIVDPDKKAVSEKLEKEVYDYIETQRPTGAKVTVKSARELAINVNTIIYVARGYSLEDVKLSFEKNLVNYFKQIAFNDTYVSIAKIGNILLGTEGVLDYSSLKLNNTLANISLEEEDIPILGTIIMEVQ